MLRIANLPPLTTLQLLARVKQLNSLIRAGLENQNQDCYSELLDIIAEEFGLSSLQPLSTALQILDQDSQNDFEDIVKLLETRAFVYLVPPINECPGCDQSIIFKV